MRTRCHKHKAPTLTVTDTACLKSRKKQFPWAPISHFKLKLELSGGWHLILQTPLKKINNGFSHVWTLLASNTFSSLSMTDKQEDASNGIKQLFVIPQL